MVSKQKSEIKPRTMYNKSANEKSHIHEYTKHRREVIVPQSRKRVAHLTGEKKQHIFLFKNVVKVSNNYI